MKNFACALVGIVAIVGIIYLTTLEKPNNDAAVGVGIVGVVVVAMIKEI